MQVGNLLHKWNVENDQACNKLPTSFQPERTSWQPGLGTSFQLVRLVGCGLNHTSACYITFKLTVWKLSCVSFSTVISVYVLSHNGLLI